MKSIRRSLLLYYSLLVAVALGAVSILVYQEAGQTLQAKEVLRAELLTKQYQESRAQEERRLDNLLAEQARTLANQARIQFQIGRPQAVDYAPLNTLSRLLFPQNLLAEPIYHLEPAALWAALTQGPMPPERVRSIVKKIVFNEDLVRRSADDQIKEFFQINSRAGMWRSRSMITADLTFPFDPARVDAMQLVHAQADEIELEPGFRLRRVTFKTPVAGFENLFGRPTRPEGRGPQRGADRHGQSQKPAVPRPPPPTDWPAEMLFIQCAASTTRRDAALADIRKEYDADLLSLQQETSDTLASLRTRLMLISLTTFAASLLGGIWLVRLGLTPLQRLSLAVSQVSPKDFKLPYNEHHLPSELRPIVERLTHTLAQLKRVFAREKQASADISHELRTPVAALLTMIEVALRKQRSPEEYRTVLRDCQAAGKQMSKLVERLLVLARLDAGVDTLRPRPVDVATLAEQCTNLVRPLAEARGLTLELQRNGPIEMVTDPDKLREVVTNLLHNAIEYNQPHGKVALSLARQNGTLEVEVRDTGIGIAPQAREHIFERFYREDASRGAEGLHAGLGLSIVKGYLDLMGGSIDVESEVGRGSTFRLRLPVARAPQGSTAFQEGER